MRPRRAWWILAMSCALAGAARADDCELIASALPTVQLPGRARSVAFARLDTDPIPDLIVGCDGSSLYPAGSTLVLLLASPSGGRPDGAYLPVGSVEVGVRAEALVAADFNGDGTPDLVVASTGSGILQVLMGRPDVSTGGVSFLPTGVRNLPVFPATLRAGDLTGDGRDDLVLVGGGCSAGRLLVLPSTAGPGFAPAFGPEVSTAAGCDPVGLELADLDRNGRLDAIVTLRGTGELRPFMGLGGGTFQPGSPVSVGAGVSGVAVGDLDADGIPDLAVGLETPPGGATALLFGSGDGATWDGGFEGLVVHGSAPARLPRIADLDGDGSLDVLATGAGGKNLVTVLRGHAASPAAAHEPWVLFGDFPRLDGVAIGDAGGSPVLIGVSTQRAGLLRWSVECAIQPDVTPSPAGTWTPNGLAVAEAPGSQRFPSLVPDAGDGAIVVWEDTRTSPPGIRAQRLGSDGLPRWGIEGRIIAKRGFTALSSRAVADGAGGVYVGWSGNAGLGDTVWIQRLDSDGQPAPGWPAAGVPALTRTGSRFSMGPLVAVSDGGAMVAVRSDSATSNAQSLIVQRIDAHGVVAAGWPELRGDPFLPFYEIRRLIPRGPGGFTIGVVTLQVRCHHQVCSYSSSLGYWRYGAGGYTEVDHESFAFEASLSIDRWDDGFDLVAGHRSGKLCFGPAGTLDVPESCRDIAILQGESPAPALGCTGPGGALLAWGTAPPSGTEVRVTHLRSDATFYPPFPPEGALVRAGPGAASSLVLQPIDWHGGLLGWVDTRADAGDLYVHWQDGRGVAHPEWPFGGVPVAQGPGTPSEPRVLRCRDGSIVMAWQDTRVDAAGIYAQRFAPGDVPVPVLATARLHELEPGRVVIRWDVPAAVEANASLERHAPGEDWSAWAPLASLGGGRFELVDDSVTPGSRYGYRLLLDGPEGAAQVGEIWVDVPSVHRFHLGAPAPNPAGGTVRLELGLVTAAGSRLAMFDLAGRRVRERDLSGLAPGRRTIELSTTGLPPGLYWVVLESGGRRESRRLTLLR